jgi:hypothetical protein
MKFCTVVPEICHGQVHGARKERRITRTRRRIIIIKRNGAKTISLQTLFGRLKYGEDKILYLKKEVLETIYDKLNPFWRDVLLNLSELLPPKEEEEKDIINILSQPIWLNFNIKRNGNFFLLLTNIVIMVSSFINNIVSEDKQCLLYQ